MKIFENKIESTIGLKITWVVSLEPVELWDLGKSYGNRMGFYSKGMYGAAV